MHRRDLLLSAGMLAALSAGCLTDGGPDDPDTGDDGTATQTPTKTPDEPRIVDRSFDVTDSGCGTGTDEAAVRYETDTVVVDGTIPGSNGCYTAELERASYDADADRLTVAVRSVEKSPNGACVQCIVDIQYVARFTFDGGRPEETVVTHDGTEVTRASRQ